MPLLERDALVDSLAAYADEARAGDSRLVLVGGEAGVGKSTLLDALQARVTDARWLWGACDGSFTPVPLGPLFDVASQVGGALLEACRGDAARGRLFRTLLDELTGSTRLAVLVVEDIHWADEATLDMLRFIGARLRDARVLLLLTYRDDGLGPGHPLRASLGDFATLRATRRVGLPPLSIEAVRHLASGTGIEPMGLFERTGGNPFLVTEVIETGSGEVPPSVRDAVLARAARLSPGARRVLDAASVLGTRVPVDILRQVAPTGTDTLDECLTSGALISDAHVFRFRHEIARSAVEEALPSHRRTELHRRVLDVLIRSGAASPARLAHHAEGAGDGRAVLTYAPRAAQGAAKLAAHREAADQYERALRFADEAEPTVRAQLFDALGAEAALIDRWEQAAAAHQAALELWREIGNDLRVGDCLRLLSRDMWRLCRGEETHAAAEAALAVLEALPPTVELASALSQRAQVAIQRGESDALSFAHRATVLAERLGDSATHSDALASEGTALLLEGEGGGISLLRRALEVALAAGNEEQAGRAYVNVHAAAAETHRFSAATRIYGEAIAYAEEHDIATYGHCLRNAQGYVLEKLGHWDEADALAVPAVHLRDLSAVNRINRLLTLARIRARRGRPDAWVVAEEASRLAENGGEPSYIVASRVTRAELAWISGRNDGAVRHINEALDVAPLCHVWVRGSVASWAHRLGVDCDVAGLPTPYALELAGDPHAAAAAWLHLGCPYDGALALLGSAHAGDLRDAVRLLDSVGATAVIPVASAILRHRGVKTVPRGRRSTTRADRFGLTAREREILALLGGDLTNANIASQLFIAEKTVDNHVSSVLAKMQVGSRQAAARLATEARAT